jgi:putative transposase
MAYIDLVGKLKPAAGVHIWAYCLMPNHIHMVVVPKEKEGLAKLFGTAHHRYAKRVNSKHGWRGHLWQQRFYSVAMDELHTFAAMRYVELNPVRAGLCDAVDEWPWSSVHGNLGNKTDELLDSSQVRKMIPDWGSFLLAEEQASIIDSLRSQTSTGRPVGDERFIGILESKTGRRIRRCNPGPIAKK